jgi:hypothetical protein
MLKDLNILKEEYNKKYEQGNYLTEHIINAYKLCIINKENNINLDPYIS